MRNQTKKLFNSIFIPTYGMAKIYGINMLKLEASLFRKGTPFIVYSMGKVGTSTIVHSLRKTFPRCPIYHIHTLNDERIRKEESIYNNNYEQLGRIHSHLLDSIYIKKKTQQCINNKWRIVTLVREPVQRNISAFFQTLNLHGKDLRFEERIRKGGDENLINDMMQYFTIKLDQSRPSKWFDSELRKFFHIDVLDAGFERDKGYQIYRENNVEVLVIRLEDLNMVATEAFKEFVGIDEFILESKQVSGKKYYSSIYKMFLDQASFSEEFLSSFYDSQYAKTFYSNSEIKGFCSKWGGR